MGSIRVEGAVTGARLVSCPSNNLPTLYCKPQTEPHLTMTEEVLTEPENKGEEKNEKSAFTRVKERFSIKSKNKNKKSLGNSQENGGNKKDTNEKETVNENIEPEVSEERKKEETEKKPKSGGTLERVKMRLSTRKKKNLKVVRL